MKKGTSILLILLLSMMIVPLIHAVDISLSKTSYNPSETLQVEITGSFTSLKSENILIYEGDTPRSQPVISGLTKQGSIYYFYAVLPTQQGNYSLRIKDAQYIESGQTKSDTITKEFTIKQTNQSHLQINPGFIITSEDFEIKVRSLNSNQEISTAFSGITDSYSLIEEVQKTLEFSIISAEYGKSILTIGSYSIPVFMIEKIQQTNTTDTTNQSSQDNQTTNNPPPNLENLNETEIQEYIEELGETESLSCYEIGRVCLVNQECEGETVAALETACCIGDCVEKKESNSRGMIIGIVLLILIIGFVGFMYWKSKKKQKPKTTDEILKEKSGEFQERMRDKTGEVSGSLGKI